MMGCVNCSESYILETVVLSFEEEDGMYFSVVFLTANLKSLPNHREL